METHSPDPLVQHVPKQERAVERLRLKLAHEQMRNGQWTEATQNLRTLWHSMSWRREGWWNLVEEVCWSLRTCARETGDGGSIVGVEWELMSNRTSLLS